MEYALLTDAAFGTIGTLVPEYVEGVFGKQLAHFVFSPEGNAAWGILDASFDISKKFAKRTRRYKRPIRRAYRRPIKKFIKKYMSKYSK